jgi:thymidylate synthase (FAD)
MNVNVLDHGYVKLIETWGSDERIIESARMSTGKSFLGWGLHHSDDCVVDLRGTPKAVSVDECCKGRPGDEKLLRRLYMKGHTTPFEMAGATIEVQAPIMVFREWHRHRTQSYSEMSARYAPLPDTVYVPTMERMMNFGDPKNKQASKADGAPDLTEKAAEDWLAKLSRGYDVCEEIYQSGLAVGVPKELARLIMPVGHYSRMRASANLLNWLRFLRLRLPEDAQWEIRSYAAPVTEFLSGVFPRTMSLFGEEMVRNWGLRESQ